MSTHVESGKRYILIFSLVSRSQRFWNPPPLNSLPIRHSRFSPFRSIKIFILDEADEMLSRGFKDQIYDVFRYMNEQIQVILLSATMPADVLEVTKKFMRNPVRILVKKEQLTLEGIKQFYVGVEKEV